MTCSDKNWVFISMFFLITSCSTGNYNKSINSDLTLDKENKSISNENRSTYEFASASEALLISPGDQIQLIYAHDTKLNGKFRVSFEGTLKLPYSITISASGLTQQQLTKKIRDSYSDIFNNFYEIQVSITEKKRWIQITGDVSNTGNKLVPPNADITQILALNEDQSFAVTQERKDLKFLKIKRKDQVLIIDLKKYFNNELNWENKIWHGGEILSFQSRLAPDDSEFPMVRVIGDVNDPGSFAIESGKDYYSYILKAGGFKPTSNIENIHLIRGEQFKREVLTLNLEELNNIGLPQPNDTILVFHDRTSSMERKLQMGASLASILSAIAILGLVF